ncbi:MAG TPA: ABC transporter permease [Solirubrobacterales bacterium]|nr:ABC transporter permease [Solirubrobacterales bacterium]
MNGRQPIWLVARRELSEGLRSRAWRASLVVQILVVAVIAVVSIASGGDDGPSERKLAIHGAAATQIEAKASGAEADYGIRLEVRREPSAAAALLAVRDEEVDAALTGAGLATGPDADPALVALLQNSAAAVASEARLRRAGLSPQQAREALEPRPLRTTVVQPPEGEGGEGLAYLGALLLYIAIISFGYAVASSVISEKSSRVVEIVLSAIRPEQLLSGKVLGNGLLGLIQIGLIALVGLGIALPSGEISLPDSTAETVVLVFVYFVLGYVFYGCAFAAAASLVSRQEDSQSTTMPILVLLIGGYLLANAALNQPDGGLATIATFLPPLAPMVVPGRAAQGELAGWELLLSLAVMVLAILLIVRLAGRIYERSVLRFGAPLTLRDAARLARR